MKCSAVTLQGAFPQEGGIYAPALHKGLKYYTLSGVWKTSLAELYLTPSASLLLH